MLHTDHPPTPHSASPMMLLAAANALPLRMSSDHQLGPHAAPSCWTGSAPQVTRTTEEGVHIAILYGPCWIELLKQKIPFI